MEHEYQVSDLSPLIASSDSLHGDPTVSISTDHRSLGQVVALDGSNNTASDGFTSIELHEKSQGALSDLKRQFKANR